MHPYLRLASVTARALRGPRLGALDTSRIALSATAADVEVTRMNNGRYVTMMDLGRFDLAFRCGLLKPMVARRWYPMVTALSIRYRRAIRAGQRYELASRIAYFDETHFYFDQRFERGGEVCAHAFVKTLFRGPSGSLPTRALFEALDEPVPESPEPPEALELWRRAEAAMRAMTTTARS